ncbi:MAG: DAHL domain-containing protein [Leptolyngbyaceae bacterium]|nr:DAHL domain-containing protein [Leptolyngbyaceae bacterium]
MDFKQQWRSLMAHQRPVLLAVFLGFPILLISVLLIINSWSPSFAPYQTYQDGIHTLRSLEKQFNQEVLKSRYELFTSYDPIVQNIAHQKALQTQLEKSIPNFLGTREQQDIQQILAERRTALEQKEDLSELFKTQNAQLKNSLRYLPFLTERLEESFNDSVLVRPRGERSPNNQTRPTPVSPSADRTDPSIVTPELTQLQNTLNQLIRNVLLYNASADEDLADKTEALAQKLIDLENVLEVDSERIPIHLFYRHAQIILATKGYVENYTEQLLLPLEQHTDDLETMLNRAYQQANNRANLYRYVTIIWVFSLLILGNTVLLKRFRQSNPALNRYQQKVKFLANVATHLQRVQTALSSPLPAEKPSQDVAVIDNAEAQAILSRQRKALLPLVQQPDELGWLAHSLQEWHDRIQKSYQIDQEESFSFLAARLSCLTQNRRRLMTPQACNVVRSTIEQVLTAHGGEVLDMQFESDQLLALLSYPATVQLASLIDTIKGQTAIALYPIAKALDSTVQQPTDIWASAYLIVSCDAPSQLPRAAFINRAASMTRGAPPAIAPSASGPATEATQTQPTVTSPTPPQMASSPAPTPSPPTKIQMIPSPSTSTPTKIQMIPPPTDDLRDDPEES